MGREKQCQRCCQPLGMHLSGPQFSHVEIGAGLSFGVVDPKAERASAEAVRKLLEAEAPFRLLLLGLGRIFYLSSLSDVQRPPSP